MTWHNITQNQRIASRAIISALVLWLAFSGMAAGEQLYVNESGWWHDGGAFNASGTPIQAAVDAAGEGDAIYMYNGSYSENVDVNKRLTLEGEGADVVTVTAADSGDHVFEVTADYVNISGFAVRGATDSGMAGIHLTDADYCNISENNVYGNDDGTYLSFSSNNMLKNNTVSSNNYHGIHLFWSSYNTLKGNIISNNYYGIHLSSSKNNTLTNNTVKSKTWYGIDLYRSSNNNTIDNNTVNSNSGNGYGIHLEYKCNYNTLTSNNCSNNNYYGIFLDVLCNYNTLKGNIISNNEYGGIVLHESCNYNTLTSNNCSNNNYGIYLRASSSCTLANNTANSNSNNGIYLHSSSNNNITCNWVQNNTQNGFRLHSGSTDNNISCNNIIENGNYNATSGGWEWQFYTDQYNPVEAKHNYWGAGMNNSMIDASIYDTEGGWGEVEFYPFETEPVPCAPGPERPAFTTTDAVIALQIAAGSRPPDLRWDVSGDGSVTSLDALMIMQALAG